jgi:aryl-alcohol dehydrogenase-like predicted oxidoreductase
MKYKRLGRTGVTVSRICLGTMSFGSRIDEATSLKIIKHAVDKGVNFIDTALGYAEGKSEKVIGKAVKGMRDQIVLATKVHPTDTEKLSHKQILWSARESLRKLDTDYIDVYYAHRPSNVVVPSEDIGTRMVVGEPTPLSETLGAMTDLVRMGKVNYLGCSNFPAWLLCKSLWVSDRLGLERFVVIQPYYNFLNQEIEREIVPLCQDQGIGIVNYSPLAGGFLTGKYKPGTPPPTGSRAAWFPNFFKLYNISLNGQEEARVIKGLEEFCEDFGRPMMQVAAAWVLSNPAVTAVVAGLSNVQQLDEWVAATEISFSKKDLDRLNQISPSKGPYYT